MSPPHATLVNWITGRLQWTMDWDNQQGPDPQASEDHQIFDTDVPPRLYGSFHLEAEPHHMSASVNEEGSVLVTKTDNASDEDPLQLQCTLKPQESIRTDIPDIKHTITHDVTKSNTQIIEPPRTYTRKESALSSNDIDASHQQSPTTALPSPRKPQTCGELDNKILLPPRNFQLKSACFTRMFCNGICSFMVLSETKQLNQYVNYQWRHPNLTLPYPLHYDNQSSLDLMPSVTTTSRRSSCDRLSSITTAGGPTHW